MLRFQLKLAVRRLLGNKNVTLINIIGLALTFTVFILLGTYLHNERSFGKNISNHSTIYRVQPENGNSLSYKTFKLLDDITGIDHKTYVMESWSMRKHFSIDNKIYKPEKILYVDSNFFKVFSYPVIAGNIQTGLENPYGVVFTRSQAVQIFGNEQVVGQKISFKSSNFGDAEYKIVAVIDDPPTNDLFGFSCVMPIQSLYRVDWFENNQAHWGNSNYQVFAQLKKNVPVKDVERSYNTNFQDKAPDWVKVDDKQLKFVPFSSLYSMNAENDYVIKKGEMGNIKTLGVLIAIILIAGTLNFINLNTAQKTKNAKVLAIENVNGASSLSVFAQFIIDAIITATLALIVSLVFLSMLYPIFNRLSGQTFSFYQFMQFLTVNGNFLIPYLLASLAAIAISFYFRANRLKLIAYKGQKSKETLRNGLSIAQFMVSIVLIAGTIAIYKQNMFMINSPSNFKQKGVICIPLVGELTEHTSAIYNEFHGIPEIDQIAFASNIIGQNITTWGTSLWNKGQEKRVSYDVIQVDSAFFDFMGLKIKEGTGFNAGSIKEMHHIINETAVKEFGIENMNDARITSFTNASGNILGVVNDFNYRSVHSKIGSMSFILRKPESLSYVYLKTKNTSHQTLAKVIEKSQSVWKQYASGWDFEYYFLDEQLEKQYDKDKTFAKVALAVTLLTVLIACIGLIGITFYMLESRIKEIGVRKVNGAKVSEVISMLNVAFVKWVVISFVIACPLAFYAIQKWLDNFAYKTTLNWWIFALAGATTLIFALVTTSWQSWWSATRNPVEALRYE